MLGTIVSFVLLGILKAVLAILLVILFILFLLAMFWVIAEGLLLIASIVVPVYKEIKRFLLEWCQKRKRRKAAAHGKQKI